MFSKLSFLIEIGLRGNPMDLRLTPGGLLELRDRASFFRMKLSFCCITGTMKAVRIALKPIFYHRFYTLPKRYYWNNHNTIMANSISHIIAQSHCVLVLNTSNLIHTYSIKPTNLQVFYWSVWGSFSFRWEDTRIVRIIIEIDRIVRCSEDHYSLNR